MTVATNDTIGLIADRRRRKVARSLGALGLVLGLAVVLSLAAGAVPIAPDRLIAILGARLGLPFAADVPARDETILLAIRLPRAILGLLVGGTLAVAGAAMQGLFRNPLADPALIGVSSGAALAAGAAIVLAPALAPVLVGALGPYLVPLAAFGGSLGATALVYRLARRHGHIHVPTMLLAGVAINAITMAGMGLLIFASDDQQMRDLSFWMLGSLGGVTWDRLAGGIPFLVAILLAVPFFARPLNAFLLGESAALHLGVDVEKAKRRLVVLVALGTGAAVALTGVIGFVGLVVPHVVRMVLGPDHRSLLPASILLGGAVMLVADLAARTLALPAELPIGILTALVGGPFFLWLLVRRRAIAGW